MNFFWRKPVPDVTATYIAKLLAEPSNMVDFLGIREARIPAPEEIISDAAKLTNYAHSSEYKVFAKEVWARALTHLDALLNEKTPNDQLNYHRASLKAHLDLLRLSAQARATKDYLEREGDRKNAPSPR